MEIYSQLVKSAGDLRTPNLCLMSGAWVCCWRFCLWPVELTLPPGCEIYDCTAVHAASKYLKSIREQTPGETKQPAQDSHSVCDTAEGQTRSADPWAHAAESRTFCENGFSCRPYLCVHKIQKDKKRGLSSRGHTPRGRRRHTHLLNDQEFLV